MTQEAFVDSLDQDQTASSNFWSTLSTYCILDYN